MTVPLAWDVIRESRAEGLRRAQEAAASTDWAAEFARYGRDVSGHLTQAEIVRQDFERMNKRLVEWDALVTLDNGEVWIDPAKVHPDFMRAYQGLQQYAYANGLLP